MRIDRNGHGSDGSRIPFSGESDSLVRANGEDSMILSEEHMFKTPRSLTHPNSFPMPSHVCVLGQVKSKRKSEVGPVVRSED